MSCLSKIIKSNKVSMGNPVLFTSSVIQSAGNAMINMNNADKLIGKRTSSIPSINIKGMSADKATIEAKNILEKAQADAIAISQSIINDEIQKGYNEGIRRAEETYAQLIDEIVKLKEKAYKEYKEKCNNSEKDIIEMAFILAEKIIATELERSNDYIVGLVESTLEKAVNKKNITLKVSPHDYYMIQDNFKFISAKVEGFGEINIISDDSLATGSVIAETQFGILDGSVNTRLTQAKKVALDLIAQNNN